MFDFRRITLFCFEKRLTKHKMTLFSKIFAPPWLRLWPQTSFFQRFSLSDSHLVFALLCQKLMNYSSAIFYKFWNKNQMCFKIRQKVCANVPKGVCFQVSSFKTLQIFDAFACIVLVLFNLVLKLKCWTRLILYPVSPTSTSRSGDVLGPFLRVCLRPLISNTHLLVIKHIFRLFRHVTAYLVHWANNQRAAIEIFPSTHQKKWRYNVWRLKQPLQSIICTRLYK